MKNNNLKNMKKILIVEDEQTLSKALALKLTSEGFNVLRAQNGEEGLEVALREQPNLILLDIIMPKMDGITMLNKLREDEWGKDVSVFMLTNLSSAEEVDKATKKGVYDYLVKSDWKLEEIVNKIKEELK
jgi:two-component system, OmpR family, alkaline phosphatase synthesis response regulator PhoP